MKKILILIALILSLFSNANAAVTLDELKQVESALYKAFLELRPTTNDKLSINTPIPGLSEDYWWDIDMIHASYVREESTTSDEVTHNIYLMGGFARLEGMTPDGLALTGCHEIGHGIGGAPFKNPSMGTIGSTAEGQADYFATKVCLPVVFKYLSETMVDYDQSEYEQGLCSKQSKHENSVCLRLFRALESDISFFAHLGSYVAMDEFSTNEATVIIKDPSYYPDAQCRLDTMINGILDIERPICWYPNGLANGTSREL
ncbi:MAG: hypothetical protein BM556_03405 [Bacteriovorax sp. MedPE-SWde]|nr:MAG: hypothetical protein BM556_03405 [Bacteriovorax sp. MedPE-SWde]